VGELLERLCEAARRWDERSGVSEPDGGTAWYVLGYVLEQPNWRAVVERELEEIPTVASMRTCLAALVERGRVPETELIPRLIRAVDGQLESLSEDHAKVLRRRRRWLADAILHPQPGSNVEQGTRAMLTPEVVWEEMRRYRVYLDVWREVTAGLV
jgi:hypothetical protein